MTPDDIQIRGEYLFHASQADVRRAEKQLGVKFPAGYRNFIGRFGEGLLAEYVRVYPPHQILEGDNSVTEWRKRIRKHWFWKAGRRVLTKKRALECVIVADTVDGDEVIFHPSSPDELTDATRGTSGRQRRSGERVIACDAHTRTWLRCSSSCGCQD